MRLYEKYRPHSLADIVGQPDAVKTIRGLIARGSIGSGSFWLAEKSGTGKTCPARILASHLADPFYVTEIVGREVTPKALARIRQTAQLYSLGKGGRVWIINEAHGLPKAGIELLLDWLEALPDHVAVIFTTTRTGQKTLFEDQADTEALLSRCIEIPMTCQGINQAFAEHVRSIATQENLNGRPASAYLALANRYHGNCRKMLEDVEAGKMLAPNDR